MKIAVKLLGLLGEKVGVSTTIIELPEKATVKDLLEKLTEKHPKIKDLLSGSGEFSELVQVLVNGRSIHWLKGLETEVKSSDEVVIVPPAGGG